MISLNSSPPCESGSIGFRLITLLIAIVLLITQIGYSISVDVKKVSLEELCDGSPEMQKNPIGFGNINDVRKVLTEFEEDQSTCSKKYHRSLVDLMDFTDEHLLADVCSLDTYQKIRAYHEKYISIYTPDKLRDDLVLDMKESPLMPIPPVARQFFILFVQQISAICKKHLVARVDSGVNSQLREIEYDIMDQIREMDIKMNAPTGKKRPRSIQDLLATVPEPESPENDGDTLYIQVRYGNKLKVVSDACHNIFTPIIDEVFRPVILLDNLGYWDINQSREENKQLKNKVFRRWYPVVKACEALKDIEVLQDSSSKAATIDMLAVYGPKGDKKQLNKMKFLTKAESEQLKAQIEANIIKYEDVDYLMYPEIDADFSHQPQNFGEEMYADEPDEWKSGLGNFESKTKNLIKDKTDWYILKIKKIKSWIIKYIHNVRREIVTQDESTVLGRFSSFLARHENEITIAIIAIQIILFFL